MAQYFANMDEPPRWLSTLQSLNVFFPDDGYSSPRSSTEIPRTEEQDRLEQQKFIMAMSQGQAQGGGDSDYLRSRLWWLGISLMILGEVGNFVGKCRVLSVLERNAGS